MTIGLRCDHPGCRASVTRGVPSGNPLKRDYDALREDAAAAGFVLTVGNDEPLGTLPRLIEAGLVGRRAERRGCTNGCRGGYQVRDVTVYYALALPAPQLRRRSR
jgi:hypothetical protein